MGATSFHSDVYMCGVWGSRRVRVLRVDNVKGHTCISIAYLCARPPARPNPATATATATATAPPAAPVAPVAHLV